MRANTWSGKEQHATIMRERRSNLRVPSTEMRVSVPARALCHFSFLRSLSGTPLICSLWNYDFAFFLTLFIFPFLNNQSSDKFFKITRLSPSKTIRSSNSFTLILK